MVPEGIREPPPSIPPYTGGGGETLWLTLPAEGERCTTAVEGQPVRLRGMESFRVSALVEPRTRILDL